jgi:hypothetical protein
MARYCIHTKYKGYCSENGCDGTRLCDHKKTKGICIINGCKHSKRYPIRAVWNSTQICTYFLENDIKTIPDHFLSHYNEISNPELTIIK